MSEYGIVYVAKNKINGKCYVGQTVGSLARRRANHRDCAVRGGSEFVFHKAIQKYGIETFDFSIMQSCCGRECLNESERWWIHTLKVLVPSGYNLTSGGEGAVPSQETRRKMSAASKKKIADNPEGFQRLLEKAHESLRGTKWTPERRAAMKPRKLSPEHKEKILAALTGRRPSKEERRRISEGKKGKPRPDMIGNRWALGRKTNGNENQIKISF